MTSKATFIPRRGTNAFALKMKENYKNHLREMENIKEDDELYDPYEAPNKKESDMFAGIIE